MTDTSKEAVEQAAVAYETIGRPGLAAMLRQLQAQLTAANEKLASAREALEIIAAQDSGRVGSTDRADCMASIARVELRNLATHPTTPASHEGQ